MPTRLLAALALLALAPAAIAQTKPAAQPPAPTTPETVPAPDPTQQVITTVSVKPAAPSAPPVIIKPSTWKPGQPIANSDDLLSALENADLNFRSLQADLRKTKLFGEVEGGGSLIYDGRVIFVSEPPDPSKPGAKPRRMFQVDFTSTTVDNVKKAEQRTFVFDGQWFVERQPDVKQVHKRQIVPPGQTVDPLAIGEGPFPIPIGQKRERILQRFTAELLPADSFPASADDETGSIEAKKAADFVKDTWQLKLVPRPAADESKQYREVRIWYRKSDLLPRFARTIGRDDSVNVVALMKIKLNEPVPPGAFDVSVPTGWDAQIDEYRAPPPGTAENPPGAAPDPTAEPAKNR